MSPLEYGQWYYLIYLVPGGMALLTLMLSMMGGGMRHHRVGHAGGHHGGGLKHAGGVRHAGSGPRHGGSRAGGVKHHTARAGARVKVAAGQVRASFGDQMLGLIGFGKIPPPFVWGSLLLGWSVFGFSATRLLEASMRHPALFVLPSMGIAAAGAIVMSRLTSTVLGRLVPQDVSLAMSTVDLCGLNGKVAFQVDETRGRVHVYDDHGTMHDCSARIAPGQLAIARGQSVMIVDYDPQRDQLIVEEAV